MNYGEVKRPDPGSNADWSAYAAAYDLLSKHNPEYKALMRDFEDFLSRIETPGIIYDVGEEPETIPILRRASAPAAASAWWNPIPA